MDVDDSITANSDRVIQAEKESPKLEPTAGDGQDSLDPNNTEYWYNVNLQARQAMWEMTGNDDTLSDDNYPDIVKNISRMTMRAWAEHDALPVEQQTGCEVPGCQCNGRVEFMVRGSEDMTETHDSEWEDPVDRDNRSYVMSNNYNLSEGMAPRTYTPPLRRNRRRRYAIRKKYEMKIQLVILVMMNFSLMRNGLFLSIWFNQGWLLIMLTGQLETGTITVDVGRGPEVKMTLPAMKILIRSTDRSRNWRRQGPVLRMTVSV